MIRRTTSPGCRLFSARSWRVGLAGKGGAMRVSSFEGDDEVEMGDCFLCRQLGPGEEGELLAFLERDPVKNLRLIWVVRRWGLLNLGLAEQGAFLAACSGGEIHGVLLRDNLGLWRADARGDAASDLVRAALDLWGLPEAFAGPREEVEEVLDRFPKLAAAASRKEEEVSLVLRPEGSVLGHPWRAEKAKEEDLESLVALERSFQLEFLGSVSRDWEIRLRMLRAVEGGVAALARWEDKAVAKAELEAVTPRADELGGVYTLPGYRRRGLAAEVCSLLCYESLSQGKVVRLETRKDNPAAMALYRKLGFRELFPHLVVIF